MILFITTYHNVTTSLEYVFVGTDFALARPGNKTVKRSKVKMYTS